MKRVRVVRFYDFVSKEALQIKSTKAKAYLIAAVCSGIAGVLQIIGLARYLGRLPEDALGIALYIVTIVAFIVGAIGFYTQWKKENQTIT